MALKIPGLKIFSGIDARSRIFLLFAGVVAVSLTVYMLVRFLGGTTGLTGPTSVANAPKGLTSVPGGELNPQYEKTLEAANVKRSQQGISSKTAAVPTIINAPTAANSGQCGVICPSEDNANVKDDINSMVSDGTLSQDDANSLLDLATKDVSTEAFAGALDAMMKSGKLTPEQARLLLERYKKQHENQLVKESAALMDNLIKAGQLPLNVANELLDLQKHNASPAEYAAALQRLKAAGEISPEAAATLLAQYTQQKAQEAALETLAALRKMAAMGQITPDVLKALEDLQARNLAANDYSAELNRLVADGKMTPATAAKILDLYKHQRTVASSGPPIDNLLAKGGVDADFAKHLLDMEANNASLADFSNALKDGVAKNYLTPDEARQLYDQYQAMLAKGPATGIAPTIEGNVPEFVQIQRRIEKSREAAPPVAAPPTAVTTTTVVTEAAPVATGPSEAELRAAQERQQRIQQLLAGMSGQAQSLIAAWQPPVMLHKDGSASSDKGKKGTIEGGAAAPGSTTTTTTTVTQKKPAFIKAGTIIFGVLDTAVNSDYPDTPVMVTIIEGKYKNAKLLGKLSLAQNGDKVSLSFNLMDMDGWASAKPVNAFAIDPDTARTVMASDVDYHYLQKYGYIMATSFLQGYSSSITNAGTSTTGIFGTSTTHPSLSPSNKFMVGLGQIGTTLTADAQNKINRPATVKVDAGVGLGILFTAEVTESG